MRLSHPLAATAVTTAASFSLLLGSAAPALAHEGQEAEGSLLAAPVQDVGTATGGMTFLKNVQYPPNSPTTAQNGTDVEFLKAGAKEYAIAGTNFNGLQIVDITVPENPVLAATYDCKLSQGDVQVFRQGARILATYTQDANISAVGLASDCARQFPDVVKTSFNGTVLVDLTDPLKPTGLSAIQIDTGSHNMTVHPSGNFLYNSNSELATDGTPTIEIVDISNPLTPKRLPDFAYPPSTAPAVGGVPVACGSLGCNSHDVTFRPDGKRGYSASLNTTLIFNTEDPAKPVLIEQIENARVNVEHDVKYLPLVKPDGTTRELLLIGDEIVGAAGNLTCPGGGITVFDITGALETNPVDLGTWFINDKTGLTPNGPPGAGAAGPASITTCTAHVFQLYPEQGLLTIAWYQRGVRVLDVSGLATFTPPVTGPEIADDADGVGMKEIGSYFFPEDSDTWSFKTNRIAANGSFIGYGNDLNRGFDAYRFPGFADGKTVPPLEPVDLAGPAAPDAVIPEVPVAVLLPLTMAAAFGTVVIVRRRRAAGPYAA